MLRKIFPFIFIFFNYLLFADITVKYDTNIPNEIIVTKKINSNVKYFASSELNKAFQAKIQKDYIDQRLTLQIYNNTFIFLLETSYLTFNDQTYNLKYPLIYNKGKVYIPITFLTEILPKLLPNYISYQDFTIQAKTPFDNSIKTIIIDPGHGGKDPGAIGVSGNVFEKNITLKIAKKVKYYLHQKLKNVKVVLTRDKDEFVSLQSRTKLANDLKADVFVSIHCNANRNHKARGTEVYYLSTAKTNEARAVEALENSVVEKYEGGLQAVKKYDDLAFILADMSQNEHLEESYRLSDILEEEITKETGFYKRGVKQANFYVMRGAFMPAVLIETGFLTNEEEEKLLNSEKYQDKIAKAIADGIIYFKKKHDSK